MTIRSPLFSQTKRINAKNGEPRYQLSVLTRLTILAKPHLIVDKFCSFRNGRSYNKLGTTARAINDVKIKNMAVIP